MLAATGLPAVARMVGVSIDSTFATFASVLTGIAGPDALIESLLGPTRLAKLDLLTQTEHTAIQKVIDLIVSPLEMMNRRLAQNMGRNSPDALELLACGAFSSPTMTKLSDQGTLEKSLRRHMDALARLSSPGLPDSLYQDLTYDPLPAKIESIQHPQFVLRGAAGSLLKSLIGECHFRTALVVQPRLSLACNGSQPAKVMKVLTPLLDGLTITKRPASIERGRDSSLQAKAHVILSLARPEIEALSSVGDDHLNRFLWITEGKSQDRKPGDPNSSRMFCDAFQRAAEEILRLRRDGRALVVRFETGDGLNAFEEGLRQYEADVV